MDDKFTIGFIIWQEASGQGFKKVDFAKKMDVSRQTLDNWINGESNMDFEDVQKASKILKRDFGKAELLTSRRIPFYDIEASAGHNGGDVSAVTQPTGTIDIGDLLRDSEAALRIGGNSMMPGYPPGCVVGLIRRQSLRIVPGEVYVYETREGRWIKRLFYKNDDPASDTFTCISDTVTKFESGPREGKFHYPAYDLKADEIINLFTVVGVIKRNSNGMINYKN